MGDGKIQKRETVSNNDRFWAVNLEMRILLSYYFNWLKGT